MPWLPEIAAQDKFHDALFTIEELHGDKQAIRMLEQEINRIRVYSTLKAQRQKLLPAPAPGAPTESAAAIAAAVKALKFYGEETNYTTPKTGRDRKSVIAKDGGFIAQKALAALAEDEESE